MTSKKPLMIDDAGAYLPASCRDLSWILSNSVDRSRGRHNPLKMDQNRLSGLQLARPRLQQDEFGQEVPCSSSLQGGPSVSTRRSDLRNRLLTAQTEKTLKRYSSEYRPELAMMRKV